MKKLLGVQVDIEEMGVTEFLIITKEFWENICNLKLNIITVGEMEDGILVEREFKCTIETMTVEELKDTGIVESDREMFFDTISSVLIENNTDLDIDEELDKAEEMLCSKIR